MYDLHMHSKASFDGHHSVAELATRALELGLSGIAVTDHIDQVITPRLFDFFTPPKLALTAKESSTQTAMAREEFAGKLEILRGIELGQPLHNRELSEFILHTYDYDFVLGSVHNLRATEDFYFIEYEGADHAHAMLKDYFAELLDMVQWGDFDSLAHLTYPLRYMVGRDSLPVDTALFKGQTDEILALLAEKDKALEINTSGLRQDIKNTLPGIEYLRRFKELGGEFVTLGSDAHRIGDLGYGLEKGAEIAQSVGFECLTIFRERQAVQVPFGTFKDGIWTT